MILVVSIKNNIFSMKITSHNLFLGQSLANLEGEFFFELLIKAPVCRFGFIGFIVGKC